MKEREIVTLSQLSVAECIDKLSEKTLRMLQHWLSKSCSLASTIERDQICLQLDQPLPDENGLMQERILLSIDSEFDPNKINEQVGQRRK